MEGKRQGRNPTRQKYEESFLEMEGGLEVEGANLSSVAGSFPRGI